MARNDGGFVPDVSSVDIEWNFGNHSFLYDIDDRVLDNLRIYSTYKCSYSDFGKYKSRVSEEYLDKLFAELRRDLLTVISEIESEIYWEVS